MTTDSSQKPGSTEKQGVPEGAPMTILEKAIKILSRAYGGEHHIPGEVRLNGIFAECNVFSGISTYDDTKLTRLVLGAHDECCRLEIMPSGPGRIKLRFSNRRRPEDCGEYPLMLGHATIEQAIEAYRYGERGDQLPKKRPAEGCGE